MRNGSGWSAGRGKFSWKQGLALGLLVAVPVTVASWISLPAPMSGDFAFNLEVAIMAHLKKLCVEAAALWSPRWELMRADGSRIPRPMVRQAKSAAGRFESSPSTPRGFACLAEGPMSSDPL